MKKLGLAAFLAAMGLLVAAPSTEASSTMSVKAPRGGASCGDGKCSPPEDCKTCPQDCGSCCGNNRCEPPEDCNSCPQDCGHCK